MRKYLSLENILYIHQELIDEFGGASGILDITSLESAVARPQSGYYNDIYEEAAALMESLAINHPFIDGNKRIAFFATDIFLRINGYIIECDNEIAHSHFMALFEENSFNFKNLLSWLKSNTIALQ